MGAGAGEGARAAEGEGTGIGSGDDLCGWRSVSSIAAVRVAHVAIGSESHGNKRNMYACRRRNVLGCSLIEVMLAPYSIERGLEKCEINKMRPNRHGRRLRV